MMAVHKVFPTRGRMGSVRSSTKSQICGSCTPSRCSVIDALVYVDLACVPRTVEIHDGADGRARHREVVSIPNSLSYFVHPMTRTLEAVDGAVERYEESTNRGARMIGISPILAIRLSRELRDQQPQMGADKLEKAILETGHPKPDMTLMMTIGGAICATCAICRRPRMTAICE
jgi:hypothetical protein